MASLVQLKLSMTISVLLVTLIFAAFLAAVTYLLNFHVIFAVVGALIFILAQYVIGPTIVRVSTGLRYLNPGENPWLESTVRELAEKSGVPTPKLAVVPDATPNAFVFGRTARDATLAVHEGLLTRLNQDEIKGVIGHELGHIRHKDYLVMTALSALPLIAYLIARASFEAVRFGRPSRKEEKAGAIYAALVAIAAIGYVVYIVTLLCVLRTSRLREHYADAYSAYLIGNPRNLESALTKITYGLSLSPKPPHGARTLYIGDPALAKEECRNIIRRKDEYDLDKDGVLDERELELAMEREAKSTWTKINVLFATHPPTFRRILLLREIEKEMESGRYTSDRMYTHV